MIQYEKFVAGAFQVNCFVLYDTETKEAFIIDPAWENEAVANFIVREALDLKGYLMTHAHGDHHMGLNYYKKIWDVPVYMHASDVSMAQDAVKNYSYEMPGPESAFTPEVQLQDGMKVKLGEQTIRVIHTPGHTRGGICFLIENLLFAGDTLFQGSIGRTDLEGGNHEQLIRSIQNQLMKLPEETLVFPGHGPETTIGREKLRNPYLR